MVSAHELQELIEFVSEAPPVVSFYQDVDVARGTKEQHRLTLRALLKQAGAKADPADLQAIERFFDFQYDGSARSIILFTCQQHGLWRVYPLAVPIESRVVVARRPYVTPLQDVLDEYASYAVVLVDQEGARLFHFNLGELQEISGTLGDELKHHKQGGWAAPRLQRKADGIAVQNFKEAVEATKFFYKENNCQRIILAGTDENVAAFRGLLPRSLQDRVAGEMHLDMMAGEVEVRDKTLALIQQHRRQEEDALVQRMVTAAMKAEGAVIGLADTLNALQQDRVQILVVAERYETVGSRCTQCGVLAGEPLDTCPYCGSSMRAADHVIDSTVRLAIEKGVKVKVLTEDAALRDAGHVGAILRY